MDLFAFCYLRDPEVMLPENLEIIERHAFTSAGAFDLKIPDSVKTIEVGAFYWGPHPITSLPYDKGWDSEWPYGEMVEIEGLQGKLQVFTVLKENVGFTKCLWVQK